MKSGRMLLRAVCVLLLALLFCLSASAEESASMDELYREQLEASGAGDLFNSLPQETRELLENLGITGLDADSLTALQPQNAAGGILGLLSSESHGALGACGVLLGIILLCALMDSVRQTVKEPAVSEVFGVICALAACVAVLVPLSACIQRVGEAAESSWVFMTSFVRVYVGRVVTGGQGVRAGSENRVVRFVEGLISLLTTGVIVPLMTVSLALGLTGSLSPGMKLDGVGNMLSKSAGWLLGITTTLFVGLLSLQGIVGAAADTLANRAIRFSISSFVPVVGGSLSEAFGAVRGCLALLKSTVGGFGILATALIVLPPVLECAVWAIGLSLCGAAAELFGLGPLAAVLKSAQTVVKTLIGVLAACSLFMIIATTIVTKATAG